MLQLNHTSVKRVFIFFLFYLPLQYAMIGILGVLISEPWPAFALPGFKNVYITEGQTKVTQPHFYAKMNDKSGEFQKVEISEYQLFYGINESQMQGFIRTHFSEPKSFTSDARQWLKDRVEQVYPESNSTELSVIWKEIMYVSEGEDFRIETGQEVKVIDISLADEE